MFKKDTYWMGILIGIIFPVVCFGILYGLRFLLGNFFDSVHLFSENKMMFASAALNVLPLRYLFVAKNFQKSAQGVLLITVVMIIVVTLAF